MLNANNLIAIVVTYNPCLSALDALLDATAAQVHSIVIVDNTPGKNDDLLLRYSARKAIHQIHLATNMGIAYAHNVGLEWASQQGADYVLILDQDSVPQINMVQKLMANINSDAAKKLKIIATGPAYEDSRTGLRSYFMVSKFGIPYRYKPKSISSNKLVLVNFLISSGSLINMQALIDVGGMRSNYFIDHVDTEWCLRARAKGYHLVGSHDALMHHSLGDKVRRIWFFYMRNVAYHSPLRDYYMFRNTLLMLRDVEMSVFFKIFLISRLVQFASFFLLFSSKKRQRLKFMLSGLNHGIKHTSGRLDLETGFCVPVPKTSFDPE